MTDEPKKEEHEDIQSILSDLDAILTDVGGEAAVPDAKSEPPKAAAPKVEPPAPVPAPTPPKVAAPPPVEPIAPAPVVVSKIELAPREGIIKPAVNLPSPPKPVELITPVEPPKPAQPPASNSPVNPVVIEELPANTPKDQIRRVVYIYTFACLEAKSGCAVFLSQAARTISKKPLFLREVMSHEVSSASDPGAIVEKARQAKAVVILALIEGWPSAKVDELSEACMRAGLLFRSVAPADAQKKSMAVDIIVDMMLLSGEA